MIKYIYNDIMWRNYTPLYLTRALPHISMHRNSEDGIDTSFLLRNRNQCLIRINKILLLTKRESSKSFRLDIRISC